MKRLLCLIYLFSCISMLVGSVGCSRQHYRLKADRDIYSLLENGGTRDPRWRVEDYRINTDCKSRMFDPNNPDCEPMPPDDPTAHRKMHYVDGKNGSKHWHDYGKTNHTENPRWKQYLLFNENGAVPLDKDEAVKLALLHSPEYQAALENLYLAAMKVSQERFRFDVQFYGGDSLFYTANGRLRGNVELQNDADIQGKLLLATGGEIVAGLANSITWTFNGTNTWAAESIFNVGLVQPLLRGAGRKIVLENLTQSERDFLAAIRQMVFFQQGYYTKIVTGAGQQSSPGGTSSADFMPRVSGGYYSLLAEQIRIQNQRQNIIGLEENLQRFIEIFEAGQVSDVYQVEETRQTLLTSESGLLARINAYQDNVDTYIRSLGLPPDTKVDISDPLMDQFQLSSPTLTTLQGDVETLLGAVRKKDTPLPGDFSEKLQEIVRRSRGEIKILENDIEILQKRVPERVESLKYLANHLAERIQNGERIDPSIYDSNVFEKRIEKLREKEIPQNIKRLRAAFTLIDVMVKNEEPALRKMIHDHSFDKKILDALDTLKLSEAAGITLTDELLQRSGELEKSQTELESLKRSFGNEEKLLVPKPAEREAQKIIAELRKRDEYRDWVRRVLAAFQYELVSLSLMQTRTRLDAITLVPTSISAEEAFDIASQNRLDWMNRRTSLVDSWRQIDLAANRLKGELNLTLDGEIGTVDRRGVRFDGKDGRLRAGLDWDSPLTRYSEMMDYRRSQIAYQNARRDYYTYVDSVNAELRSILRAAQNHQIDFEINRNAILIDTIRVDVMQLRMEQPAQRGKPIDASTSRQLIDALNGLMNSQNSFLNTWVAYQTQRMLLDLNMGTMELDKSGRWIDPGIITKERSKTGLTPLTPGKQTDRSKQHKHYTIPPAPTLAPPIGLSEQN